MKIKFKNTEPVLYGYELDCIATKACLSYEGPFTHIEANFKKLNSDYTIPFDVRGSGLFTNIEIRLMARKLKNKNIAECMHEFIKFVNKKHTIMGAAYLSIIEHIPIEVIESINGLSTVYDVIPKRYQPMAEKCIKANYEKKKKEQNYSNTSNI